LGLDIFLAFKVRRAGTRVYRLKFGQDIIKLARLVNILPVE
jgi:hypothetical protein